jgi:multiple sugar transport system substrate-binding protein
MKKLLVVLAVLGMVMSLPVMAQDGGCNIEPPAEPVQVTMIGWTFPILDYYASEIESCNQVDNLDVNTQILQSADAQSEMRLAASSTGASPYDIIHASNSYIGEFADQGWLLPLNDLVEKYSDEYDLDDIPQALWDSVTYDGEIYAVPIIVNTQHFMYNADILEEAGIEPPQTYDDVLEICQTMDTDALNVDFPFGIVISAGWAWEIEFKNLLGAYGGIMLDENNMPMFNGEEGIDAMNKLLEIADVCLGEEGILLSTDDVQAGMANGSIAMAHLWASRAAMMDDEELSSVVGQVEFAPALFPTADQTVRGGIPWADFLAIPATSEVDHDLLFRIVMESADLESQIGATEFGLVPRLAAEEAAPRYSSASLTTIAEGGPAIDNPAINVAVGALSQFLPMASTGEMTVEEALNAAAELYIEEATAQGFISE